ncbi:MAG TPA: hypothetical protein VF037_08580 [Gemmatimonadales bacterium]
MLDSDVIVPVVMFVAIAMMFLGLARIIADALIRRRLIAAGNAGDISRMLAASAGDRVSGALKWGIVAVAAGAALVVIQLLPYDRDEPIVLGILLLFVGLGLLVYYGLARKGAGHTHALGSGAAASLGSGASFEGVVNRETVRETSKL